VLLGHQVLEYRLKHPPKYGEKVMSTEQSADEIRKVAKILDDAVENEDKELVLSCFSEDGEIEVFGLKFKGHENIRKTIDWMYQRFGQIRFRPIIIMVDGSVFFEEFILSVKPEDAEFEIKAAEVLVYEDYKIKSLRLYFDRLEIARMLSKGFFERPLINRIHRDTLKGLPGIN